jgi:hypothetical protein
MEVPTNTKVKLLQSFQQCCVAVKRLMVVWAVRRMNGSATNQIMPKHSLETLATISKLKYFGHTADSFDCMKKGLMF